MTTRDSGESLQLKALMLIRKEKQLEKHLEVEKTEIWKIPNAVRIG